MKYKYKVSDLLEYLEVIMATAELVPSLKSKYKNRKMLDEIEDRLLELQKIRIAMEVE